MPEPSVFPLNLATKEDTPERLLALASVPLAQKILATDINLIKQALNELNLSRSTDFFIPFGKVLYLQSNGNVAETEKTVGDWAITVNDNDALVIANYNGDDVNGDPTFTNAREYEK